MRSAAETIRVLHIIPSLGRGGAERQLVDVVTHSDRSRFEHIVCHLGGPSHFASTLQKDGHQTIDLGVHGRLRWAQGALALSAVVRKQRPALVHAWLLDASLCARFARWLSPAVPLLISLQNPDYDPQTIARAGWPKGRVFLLRAVDTASAWIARPQFVACSEFVRDSAIRHLHVIPSRIRTIYNSISAPSVEAKTGARERVRQELGIAPGDLVFINVGRLDPQKAQAPLLKAFAKVVETHPQATLVIAGAGPLRASLEALAQSLGIQDKVRFLGIRDDIGACLEMSDVFVFPSLFEGFGMALVEAMSVGLPCIASNVGPIPEIVTHGNNGLLVAPNDCLALADAMNVLAADARLRIALGEKGRQAARAFASAALMPKWEALYDELATRGTPRRSIAERIKARTTGAHAAAE